MTERQIAVIAISIGVVITNGLISHYLPPTGILLTPVILIIVAFLICFGTGTMNAIWKSILVFGLIGFHDILIKLYSGGTADSEGQGVIHLFLFIGLVPAFGVLLTSVFRQKQETLKDKIVACLIFPALMSVHLYLFSRLGLE